MLEVRRATILFAMMLTAACGESVASSDAGTDAARPVDAAPVPLVDIEVSITASVASFDGRVLVGAFRQSPPTMPPVAVQRLDMPSFPTRTTLRDLEPGTYYVTAVLDFAPPSPTIPGPEDTTSTSDPVVITGDETAAVEIELALSAP